MQHTLRAPILSDAPTYTEFLRNPDVSTWLEDRCQRHVSQQEVEYFMFYGTWAPFSIVVEGRFVGLTGLADPRYREDVARFFIVLGDTSIWGQGVGTAVTKEILEYGFETIGLRKIVSDYFSPNLASQKIHEKSGFTVEGTLRRDAWRLGGWVDRVIVSKLNDE